MQLRQLAIFGFVLLLPLHQVPAVRGSDNPPAASDPATKLKSLVKAGTDERSVLAAQYRKAGSDEERQQVLARSRSVVDGYANRILELSRVTPNDAAVVDALAWVVRSRMDGPPTAPIKEALGILRRHHLKDPRLGVICQTLAGVAWPEAEAFHRAVLGGSSDPEAQARACLALAQDLKAQVDELERRKSADAARIQAECEKYLDRVMREFGDVKARGTSLGEIRSATRASAGVHRRRVRQPGSAADPRLGPHRRRRGELTGSMPTASGPPRRRGPVPGAAGWRFQSVREIA
jgi:hypothetical protein